MFHMGKKERSISIQSSDMHRCFLRLLQKTNWKQDLRKYCMCLNNNYF